MFFFRLLARTSLRTRSVASRVETPEALTSFKKHTRLEVQRCGLVWYALSSALPRICAHEHSRAPRTGAPSSHRVWARGHARIGLKKTASSFFVLFEAARAGRAEFFREAKH